MGAVLLADSPGPLPLRGDLPFLGRGRLFLPLLLEAAAASADAPRAPPLLPVAAIFPLVFIFRDREYREPTSQHAKAGISKNSERASHVYKASLQEPSDSLSDIGNIHPKKRKQKTVPYRPDQVSK